ncbi:MAG: penicillin-binding protein 2 [Candidatus Omnitrophica bacterium]|nr:penicillin-binding protein 2 [Candidatus Omnitrophota bacterium]
MRIWFFSLILIVAMGVLFAGLFYVQVGMYEKYSVMSEENRLKVVPLVAPRGSIFDRNGKVLVEDVLSFDVAIIYYRVEDKDSLTNVLSEVLEVPKSVVSRRIKEAGKIPYSPVSIASNIGMEKVIRLEELEMNHPDILLEISAKRKYLYGDSAAHVVGYVGSINRSEFKRLKHYGYKINDLVGRDGVEKAFDDYLRGTHGGKQIEVDHRGREATTLGYREPLPGKDVYLTIDLELQKTCEKLLEKKKGAIVAMDPSTGAVLAMASAPAYDPGIFINRERASELSKVFGSRNYPLMNRAIAGTYPPGSVFKVITALSGLDSSDATIKTVFNCQGSLSLGKFRFACWREKGHADQILRDAIKHSCNVYFFKLGLLAGVDRISAFAKKCGLGQHTGIDIPGEKAGIVPSSAWKRKKLNERWYKGDTVNYSIGQGYLLCSPLQVARMMSIFANKGYLVKPYVVEFVDKVRVNAGEKVFLNLSTSDVSEIREGLKAVVNGKRGTGVKAKQSDVIVSGKTGTAQTSRGKKNHGWFAGFAPFDEAKLTVVVFDEHGGKGGYYAAETAGKVFKKAKELKML